MTKKNKDTFQKHPSGHELHRRLLINNITINCIAWSSDGNYLAAAYSDNQVRIWDAEKGKVTKTFEVHKDTVSISWSPTDNLLAVASSDKIVTVCDLTMLNKTDILQGYSGKATCVTWSPNGRYLASGAGIPDNQIRIWDKISGTTSVMPAHRRGTDALAWSPDGHKLASGGFQPGLIIWNMDTHEPLQRYYDEQATVNATVWSPDGKFLAFSSFGPTIALIQQSTQQTHILEGHSGPVTSLSFSYDGMLLASKSLDDTVIIWRMNDLASVTQINERGRSVWNANLHFHPSAPFLATLGDRDREIRIWKLKYDILIGAALPPAVRYTSVKVVLVGESNAGKSCLAMRLAEDRYPEPHEHGTTHGLRFWHVAPEKLSASLVTAGNERRDIVLWDMGGQREYRLVHQLFLHDTTIALVFFDPTRGNSAFEDVEAWNKSLEKQLAGRSAVKLLVGAKMDEPNASIDRSRIDQLIKIYGFSGYYETSAYNKRGVPELRMAIANAINWEILSTANRPELFQVIYDFIEARRRLGDVILYFRDLKAFVSQRFPQLNNDNAVEAVTQQLSSQGALVITQSSTGEPLLLLSIEEIEHYAGSLILAARQNQRGVPALETRSLVLPNIELPGIDTNKRLERRQELVVIESVVQLLIEHGICFQHEGLLIFPSLFRPSERITDIAIPHAISLYYDFSGAIDNIYASLVAWLVMSGSFGRVRLWQDRADFEITPKSTCGLRKVSRGGGFAHMDVYFHNETPQDLRNQFINFVEEHLRSRGVEIVEHVEVTCICGNVFDEGTIRGRIAEGKSDIGCPRCDRRTNLTDGASRSRERDPKLTEQTWALRTEIEKQRRQIVEIVKSLFAASHESNRNERLRILHLSDLHFSHDVSPSSKFQWLSEDIKKGACLGFNNLDYLVISGDFTDKGNDPGFEKAFEFVSLLTKEFDLSAERCIFVPGNHDLQFRRDQYTWIENADGLPSEYVVKKDDIFLVRNEEGYKLRFQRFSEAFYHKFLQRPFPLNYSDQGMSYLFTSTGIQFLALNSCWNIDKWFPKRAAVHMEALSNTLREAEKQVMDAIQQNRLDGTRYIRIGVWHHAVTGPETIKDTDFIEHLQIHEVKFALTGDVHQIVRENIHHYHPSKMHIFGTGSFGSPASGRPESTPRLYSLLELNRDFSNVRVHTRCQNRADSAWEGWYQWANPDGSGSMLPYFDQPL